MCDSNLQCSAHSASEPGRFTKALSTASRITLATTSRIANETVNDDAVLACDRASPASTYLVRAATKLLSPSCRHSRVLYAVMLAKYGLPASRASQAQPSHALDEQRAVCAIIM